MFRRESDERELGTRRNEKSEKKKIASMINGVENASIFLIFLSRGGVTLCTYFHASFSVFSYTFCRSPYVSVQIKRKTLKNYIRCYPYIHFVVVAAVVCFFFLLLFASWSCYYFILMQDRQVYTQVRTWVQSVVFFESLLIFLDFYYAAYACNFNASKGN